MKTGIVLPWSSSLKAMTKATPFMTNYRPGDLVLIAFPFSTGTQTKDRPVILDTGDSDVLVGKITRRRYSTPFAISLTYSRSAGLLRPSRFLAHNSATT